MAPKGAEYDHERLWKMKKKVCCVLSLALVLMIALSACGECNFEDPYLLLVARTSNWDLICPGMWSGTTWQIYSDGSYEITVGYVSDRDQQYEPELRTGKLSPVEFAGLLLACDCEWVDPDYYVDACDGQGWKIDMFDAAGNVIHTTGNMRYIYGMANVERIIHMLPDDEASYYSSAYIGR